MSLDMNDPTLTTQQLMREFGLSQKTAESVSRHHARHRHDLLSAPMIAAEYVITEQQATLIVESLGRAHRTKHLMMPVGQPDEFIHRFRLQHLVPRDIAPDYHDRLYFIQHETGGLIKIGISANPVVRLRKINADAHDPRYRILATTRGGREREKLLHEKFARHRRHGEWFAPAQELLDYIAGAPDAV